MRRLYARPLPGVPPAIAKMFDEIAAASLDGDIIDIGQAYTITGTFTPTRNLNVTTPTAANIAAVLATLISDFKAGGSTKTV